MHWYNGLHRVRYCCPSVAKAVPHRQSNQNKSRKVEQLIRKAVLGVDYLRPDELAVAEAVSLRPGSVEAVGLRGEARARNREHVCV